jgi:potassium-dependent mechanosensitive channel
VLAQTPSPTPANDEAELRSKLEEVSRKLADAPRGPISTDVLDPSTPPSYVDSLRRYEVGLRRLITLNESLTRARLAVESVDNEVKTVTARGLDEPKPYSVHLLDDLQGQLDKINEQGKSANLALTAAKTSEGLEITQLESHQALRRRLLDQLDDSPNDVELRRQLENSDIAIEASQNGVRLATAEIENARLDVALTEKNRELIKLKLTLVQESFRFSVETLKSQLEELEDSRQKLTDQLLEYEESEEVSRERLNAILQDDIDDEQQASEIQARRDWVTTHEQKARLLEERLEFNIIRRDLWERRFLAHDGRASSNYDEWQDAAQGLLVRLGKNREALRSEWSQVQSQLSDLLDTEDPTETDLGQWKDVRAQALIGRQKALQDAINYHLETEALAKRLLAEFDLQASQASLSERAAQAWGNFRSFWNIELYTIGDSAVTVGKLSVAITILIVGLAFVGRFTHSFSSRFLAKLPIRDGARHNLERIIRYVLILLLFLFSLHVVNIPLTIFTFLGGTLAIAAGFGAQNILNNFISGLILMVERPVRAGDLIEVDDVLGIVEEIGARSTRVRVPTGIHVILPNSSLLENKVINWTLKDQKIRTKVCVGVAYGSPTRKVIKLVKQAAEDEEEVIKSPAPLVTFDDFGESSLDFTVHFWVAVASPMDRDRICTKVRLALDDLFREGGIEIPFPQRDIHLRSAVPVRIDSSSKESVDDGEN